MSSYTILIKRTLSAADALTSWVRAVRGSLLADKCKGLVHHIALLSVHAGIPPRDADQNAALHVSNEKKTALKEVKRGTRTRTKNPALTFFTIDLTSAEVRGRTIPCVGRDKEIDRLIHILARRFKNNPVLLGDPGVGKTAIVEGLSARLMGAQVPQPIKGKRILSLDLGLLLAGTIYRGEFEARLKHVIEEAKQDPDVILFIDELHTVVGAGSAPGALDAANMLKPALARGEIRCIGATTEGEFKRSIEGDPALERRFQPVRVAEPSPADTETILRGIKPFFETYHTVAISDEALRAAREAAARFIPDKFFPDKAIDLIDEACAAVKLAAKPQGVHAEIASLEDERERVRGRKNAAVAEEQFEEALYYKAEERALDERLAVAKKRIARAPQQVLGTVTPETIFETVARMTGAPVPEVTMHDAGSLVNLHDRLEQHVYGQEHIVRHVVAALQAARLGLSREGKPCASFLFVGPSGVGKTALARALAQELYGTHDALVRIDMSECMEPHHVSKLIGAPPGYVGYKDDTALADRVRRKPYSVVLFDDIDKAHPDILNIMLQILDEGKLADATGKSVNFTNAVVILTTTAGATSEEMRTLGFAENTGGGAVAVDTFTARVTEALKGRFRNELLHRIGHTLVFVPLSAAVLKRIVEKEIRELATRIERRGLSLRVATAVVERLLKRLEGGEGARRVRALIEQELEQALTAYLLKEHPASGTTVRVNMQKGSLVVRAHNESQSQK